MSVRVPLTLAMAILLAMAAARASAITRADSPGSDAVSAALSEFTVAFKSAFDNADRDAAINLFYWKGVSDQDRVRVLALLDADMSRSLVGITLLEAGEIPRRWLVNGVIMEHNLPVSAHLLAEFEGPNGRRHRSLHNLGFKDGNVYIVLSAVGREQ